MKWNIIILAVVLCTVSTAITDCQIIGNRTSREFKLNNCTIDINSTYLSINMTYQVINDAAGALANQISHEWKTISTPDRHQFIQRLSGDISHHKGQLVVSRLYLPVNTNNFPINGYYNMQNSLCYYSCVGHNCECDQAYWSDIEFNIQRNNQQLVINQKLVNNQQLIVNE